MQPHVAFEHLRSDNCPGRPCTLLSRADYRAAVAAFIARWPQVKTYTAWNEANHISQPTSDAPEAAAGYYEELKAACPKCTVVAADVLDSGTYVQWLKRFRRAVHGNPQLWGLHNYSDVTYGTTTGTDNVLATVPGKLWIEETGGIVVRYDGAGGQLLSYDEARAARSISRAFAIAEDRPRITRMYLYHWRPLPTDLFDAGLERPDGTLRPSYAAVEKGLKEVRRAKATPGVTWTASWSKGRLVLRGRCASKSCRGRVKIRVRGAATFRAALRTIKIVGTRSYKGATLRLTLSSKVRTMLRRDARRRLTLSVSSTKPVKASQTVTLKLAKPPG